MARIEGDQNIPSALLDAYRATLTEKQPDGASRKRYPYRVPHMQKGGADVKAAQLTQRARFQGSISRFNQLSQAERQRWYAARPPWSSFLWYYNYFILSDLMGNANIPEGGAGVISSIQFKQMTIGAGASEGQVAITAVDTSKTVVMLYGNSVIVYETEAVAAALPIYPYVSSMASELVKCKWAIASWQGVNTLEATIGLIIIEYV